MKKQFDLSQFKLNHAPDPGDHRDQLYKCTFDVARPLPPRADLREGKHLSKVQSQGSLGSCTAQATNGAMEFLARLHCQWGTEFEGSALALYYWARKYGRTITRDSGAYIRDAIKGAAKYGNPHESLWPYVQSQFTVEPSAAAKTDAKMQKLTSFYALSGASDQGLLELKDALSRGFPVVFGFTCVTSLNSSQTYRTGIIQLPKKDERVIGGHAILAVGYDDAKEHVIIRNSWSEDWGDEGYGFMNYKWFTDSRLTDSFWVCEK